MLGSILRLVFGGIILFAIILLIRLCPRFQKRIWRVIACIVYVGMVLLIWIFPPENLFVTFSSPEAAYHYTYTGTVKAVISGEESDLVLGENRKKNYLILLPKNESGWKCAGAFNSPVVSQKVGEKFFVTVFRFRGTDDYFVQVSLIDSSSSVVSDNRNSSFQCTGTVKDKFTDYYSYVKKPDESYKITVNGTEIYPMKTK